MRGGRRSRSKSGASTGLVETGDVDIDRVGLAWIDVQGHEGHVLAGATSLLERPIPAVTEFWPEALRRAGGLDRFRALVAGRYSEVVDLRRSLAEGRAELTPTGRLDDLIERYAGAASFTDLLLID